MRAFVFSLLFGLAIGCNSETDNDGDGVSIEAGDCNDNDGSTYPGASEQCDGLDSNCDGSLVDDFPDFDTDGTPDCIDDDDDDDGSLDAEDCEPLDASIRPGLSDIPDDGVDQDCNGADSVTCYADLDGDGVGSTVLIAIDGNCTDAGESSTDGDCNDNDANINPSATEIVGNGVDDNCDGNETCLGVDLLVRRCDGGTPWTFG